MNELTDELLYSPKFLRFLKSRNEEPYCSGGDLDVARGGLQLRRAPPVPAQSYHGGLEPGNPPMLK